MRTRPRRATKLRVAWASAKHGPIYFCLQCDRREEPGKEFILIHQYKMNGYNIVIDVFSGAIHIVDEVAYDVIELFENHTKEQIVAELTRKYEKQELSAAEIEACIHEVEALKESGQLFTEDIYADKAGML